jgi:hypothetical protein
MRYGRANTEPVVGAFVFVFRGGRGMGVDGFDRAGVCGRKSAGEKLGEGDGSGDGAAIGVSAGVEGVCRTGAEGTVKV